MRNWIAMSILLMVGTAFAQPPGRGMPMHRPPEQLETLRIWKMTEFLELSEDQATKFFPAFRVHREKMQAVDSMEVALQRSISQEIKEPSIDQKYINDRVNQLIDLRQQKIRLEQEFLGQLPEYLTPEQQGKFLIFDQRFRRALREAIRHNEPGPRFKQ